MLLHGLYVCFHAASNIPKAEKHRLESAAMTRLMTSLGSTSHVATQMHAWWQEYEDATTPAARFVKDIDKLEVRGETCACAGACVVGAVCSACPMFA